MYSQSASASYRGYRHQALYSLYGFYPCRLIPNCWHFQPETFEDLSIFDSTGLLVEAVQVKSYSGNLTLSSFSPDKEDGFFRQSIDLLQRFPDITIRIVSFGPFGEEMGSAWQVEGPHRHSVVNKLMSAGFSSPDIHSLHCGAYFTNCRRVETDNLQGQIYEVLRHSVLAGNPENALELLSYWMYLAAERQEIFSNSSVSHQISQCQRLSREERGAYPRVVSHHPPT